MIRIKATIRARPGERWRALAEADVGPGAPAVLDGARASESDVVRVQVAPPPGAELDVRVVVGNVLVASTLRHDRVVLIEHEDDEAAPPLACRGRFLADWAGLTELAVEARPAGSPDWERLLVLPLAVSAGKMHEEQFIRLFSELERDSAALLLDVHGKTQVGLKAGPGLASSAPAAVLSRAGVVVRELDALLHQIARAPASRLRAQTSREQALVGQAVSEATVEEACRDPSLLGRRASALVFREHLREHPRPDYRLPEHRAFADFAEYLKAQLSDLRRRVDEEVAERESRRRWRDQPVEPGRPTWWEAEDLPRIEELTRCRAELARLHGVAERWGGLAFMPPGRCLRQRPQSTPLFRNHPLYRRAFRLIAGHFLNYQASLDTHELLTRARSLPALYEWWCAVRVVRVLARGLVPLPHDPQAGPLVSGRLAPEGRRFTIEFAPDQAINFTDGRGARVRFRYQPLYAPGRGAAVPLSSSAVRLPDMALEVYPARAAPSGMPEVIVVLDAKYSALPQREKLAEVSTKYSRIGDPRTGRVLSRQVWALTPAPPMEGAAGEGPRRFCTVDNEAFWAPTFDPANPVNGAVQAVPGNPGEFGPLAALVVMVLKMFGVEYSEAGGLEEARA